jgi:hypothetical protein
MPPPKEYREQPKGSLYRKRPKTFYAKEATVELGRRVQAAAESFELQAELGATASSASSGGSRDFAAKQGHEHART